jgi:hypothetical protein
VIQSGYLYSDHRDGNRMPKLFAKLERLQFPVKGDRHWGQQHATMRATARLNQSRGHGLTSADAVLKRNPYMLRRLGVLINL